MKHIIAFCLFISIFLSAYQVSYSQTPLILISTTTENFKDTECFVHTVNQRETIYSLCRAYKIDPQKLYEFNPEVKVNGLKFQQRLYIPISEEMQKIIAEEKEAQKNIQPKKIETTADGKTLLTENGKKFYIHTVSAGQTLYSLVIEYKVTSKELYEHNKGLSETLSIGQRIKVLCKDCIQEQQEESSPVQPEPVEPVNEDKKAKKKNKTKRTENEPETKVTQIETTTSIQSYSKDGVLLRNDIEFKQHAIDSFETVYSISKNYNVPPEVLYDYNPVLDLDSVPYGAIIKIPTNVSFQEKEYFYHTIADNESVAMISQKYRLTDEELINANKRTLQEVKVGSYLQVPINKDNKQIAVNELNAKTEYIYRPIVRNETVYRITKEFGITEKDFYMLNPTIKPGALPVKVIVKLPKRETPIWYFYSDTITRILPIIPLKDGMLGGCCDSVPKHEGSYKITLMLPLYLDQNETPIDETEIINKPKEIFKGTYPFLEYYEGLLIGIDSLKRAGVNIQLQVLDTKRDSAQVYRAISKIKKDSTDLIIGPVFSEMFSIVSAWAKRNRIPIVSPLASNKIMTKNNPYAIQVNAPQNYRYDKIAEEIVKEQNANIIIVYNSVVMEQKTVDLITKVFKTKYQDSLRLKNISVQEVLFPEHGIQGIVNAMNSTEKNIIIIPSKNQAFINNLVTKIYRYKPKFPMQLYGLPSWERFDNLELDFLFDLNFRFATKGYVDYENNSVIDFVETYRKMFKTEPTVYSFQGYEQALYFVGAIKKFGPNIFDCLPRYQKQGIFSSFVFAKKEDADGLMNTTIDIIEYNPQSLKRELIGTEVNQQTTTN